MKDADLKALLERHQGNIARVGKALGVTRQAASLRVEAAGLSGEAARLRALNGVSGTRVGLDGSSPNPDAEARMIRAALELHGSQAAAAKALGMHRRRLQRSMERLGIEWPLAVRAADVVPT